MSQQFTTRQDVIDFYVIPSLGDYAADFDVDAIAAEITEWRNGHLVVVVEGDDQYNEVLQRHTR